MRLLHAADGLFLVNVSTAKSGAGFGGESVCDAALQAWGTVGFGTAPAQPGLCSST